MSHQVIANRFEMGSFLAGGGMGDVYRGLDRSTEQPVAIKVLKPEIVAQDPDQLQRFAREGELLARLNHPNIVKVIKMVQEEGKHYIIMEYVGGGTLRDLLIEQPQLPIKRVMEIALDLADALTRAHRLNIVHRDLKPANVLIAEDGTPRLTDFGLAWQAGSELTQTGMVMGTSAYLSPEAIAGQQLDARSDIWAFGIMLYEMLGGRRPFNEDTQAALLFAIMQKPAPNLQGLRSDIPEALAHLIERMLEKEPDNRMPSVRQVGAELEAMMSGIKLSSSQSKPAPTKPTQVSEESRFKTPSAGAFPEINVQIMNPLLTPPVSQAPTLTPIEKPQRHFPVWAIVATILVGLVVVAGGLFALIQSKQENSPQATSVPQGPVKIEPVAGNELLVLVANLEHTGGEERDVARFITDDLQQKLERDIPFSTIRIRPYPRVITNAEDAAEAAELNNAPLIVWGNYTQDLIQLEIQFGVANPSNGFKYIQLTPEALAKLVNVRIELSDERRQSIAPVIISAYGILQFIDGDVYETAVSLTIASEIGPVETAEIIGTSVAADYYRFLMSFREPDTAFAAINRAIEAERSPILYAARSTLRQRTGDRAAAKEDVNTAILLAERQGLDQWATPYVLQGLQAVFADQLADASEAYGKGTELRPEDWFPLALQSISLYFSGHFDEAKQTSDQSIAQPDSPTTNFPYIVQVLVALREGHLEDAIAANDTIAREFPDPTFSNRILQAVYGSDANLVYTWFNSAAGNLFLGQFNATISDTDKAISINPNITEVYMVRGLAYCNLEQYEDAETAYSQAIEKDPNFIALYLLRADARRKLNHLPEALEDVAVVTQSDLGDEFAPYLQQANEGNFDCTSILNDPN
ncbi:MAG: protein kinase [Chloroflexi bacterium]|nr:protein kinase [Chloroflexota bacterium]